jgi:hypothetical protein
LSMRGVKLDRAMSLVAATMVGSRSAWRAAHSERRCMAAAAAAAAAAVNGSGSGAVV